MAQIKMDVSEYEAMRENKQLLETALGDLKKANEKADRLQQERISILEDAKMKVVSIKKVQTDRLITGPRDHMDIVRRVLNLIGYNGMRGDQMLDRELKEYMMMNSGHHMPGMEALFDCFHTSEVETSLSVPEITTEGLDDVKKEIRKDLKDKMDAKTKSKLENADDALKEHKRMKDTIKNLERQNINLTEANDSLNERIETGMKILDQHRASLESMGKIRVIVMKKGGLFGDSKKVNGIVDVMTEFLENFETVEKE